MTATETINGAVQRTGTPRTGTRQVRRSELAAFLRSRRERITPEDVGLPPGLRRRTAGLRREEVAQLAGVGVTWYTWLEQGRPINASVQVLDAIARTLRLDLPEREHLYRLAEIPDPATASGASQACPTITAELQEILNSLTPLPASIINERFDLLAWNGAYAAMWPGIVSAAPADRNTLWMVFTHPDCCHPYVNRDEQLSSLVAQLRGAYGRHLGEPAWDSFVARLQAASAQFALLWAEQHVASNMTYLKIFRHPAHPRMAMTTTSLGVLSLPGTRMVIYNPADDDCRDALAGLIRGEGRDQHFPCWAAHDIPCWPPPGVQPGRGPNTPAPLPR